MLDLEKPLFQATLGDLKEVLTIALNDIQLESDGKTSPKPKKHFVYGIAGLAELFKCSQPTAQRIKSSGVIDDAISQIGGIIVVDADYALDLLKVSKQYRSNLKKRFENNGKVKN